MQTLQYRFSFCYRNIVPKAAYSSEYLRQNGSCPLTPEEVGLLLCGLGFRNTTPIYVAGKVLLYFFDFMKWDCNVCGLNRDDDDWIS